MGGFNSYAKPRNSASSPNGQLVFWGWFMVWKTVLFLIEASTRLVGFKAWPIRLRFLMTVSQSDEIDQLLTESLESFVLCGADVLY